MVRYYGYYSNVSRGSRLKKGIDNVIPCILEPQGNEKIFRRNWSRLIQKIYEVDPLVCPKCQGSMRIISAIDNRQMIRAILEHLSIWLVRSRPPPKAYSLGTRILPNPPHPSPGTDFYADPEYSWDEYQS
jgi:hypothetical protein